VSLLSYLLLKTCTINASFRKLEDIMRLKSSRLFASVLLISMFSLILTSQSFAQAQTPEELCAAASTDEPATREFTEPEQVLEAGVNYFAVFCTDAGPIVVDLYETLAPETVNNFVFLAQNGYYNNTTFHRVIQDFMAQGGDPTGTGTGGPGYAFDDEFVGFLHFDQPGLLAMANAGPGTNGSQFFITTAATPHLDYQHTIFGRVVEGQESVQAIQLRDPQTASTPGTTLNSVVIVTDPSTLALDTPAPIAADEAMFQAALDEITALMSDPLALNEESTGIQTTDTVLGASPEAERAAVETVLTENGHEYRVTAQIDNAGCDLTGVPFLSFGYALDVFPDEAAAQAAASSGILEAVLESQGYTAEIVEGQPYPVFTQAVSLCDTTATHAIGFYPRGRMVAIANIVYVDQGQGATPVDYVNYAAINFERFFTTPLRAELG
jgi:cyclophilin family peptidyl-prolyl cis-trans isomerase